MRDVMTSLLYRLTVLLMLWVVGVTPAGAQALSAAPIDINAAEKVEMTSAIEWCSADAALDVAAISEGACRFVAVRDRGELTHGVSRLAFWLRFSLQNTGVVTTQRWLSIGHPRLQSVTLYTSSVVGGWSAVTTGLHVPARDRPILAERPVLPIELEAKAARTYYVRVVSETAIELSSELLTPRAHAASVQLSRLVSYMSLGAVVLASVLCFIIYGYQRDIGLLFFAGTLLSVAINDTGYTGLLPTFFWPNDAPIPIQVQAITHCSALIFFTAFVTSFVPPHPRLKSIKAVLLVLLSALVIIAAWELTISFRDAISVFTATAAVLIMTLAVLMVVAWRVGASPPALLLWGTSPVLVVIAVRMMMVLGWVHYTFLHSIGFSWILVLMSPIIITGMARRGEEQKRQLAELALDSAIRTQFLSHMSHDFRTPLSVIIRYADLLGRGSSRVSLSEAVAAIKQSSYDVLNMIDGVLDYVRRDTKAIELMPSATLLEPFLQEVETRARHLARLSHNAFTMQLDGDAPPVVRIDKARLQQVLNNLLINAHHYTRNGSVVLRCHAERLVPERCRLTFSVQDNGIGIAPKDQHRIFEPFVRGEAARKAGVEGFGIGLALCQKIIRHMGSEIELASRPGEGSTFSFAITCEISAQIEQPESSAVGSDHAPKILLVDDDPGALDFMRQILAPYDVEIWTAGSGNEAEQHWARSIDLAITDQFMANGDGWSVLSEATRHDVPTVLISAAEPVRPTDIKASLQFAAVCQKPFDADTLIDKIDRLMGGLRRRTEELEEETEQSVFERPAETVIAPLRQLIREGGITKIDQWVEELELLHPEYAKFWELVRTANRQLDFEKLRELAGAAPAKD